MTTGPDLTQQRLLKYIQAPPDKQALIDRILDGERPAQEVRGPLLLCMGAAAKLLGCSRATIWRLCKAGRLQKVELQPGSYRLRREDLERLAKGQ